MFRTISRIFAAIVLSASFSANASFHLWRITELYSNADGSVQFIELTAMAAGQQFIAGHRITSSQGGQIKTYTFPTNLPGDTAMGMAGDGYYGSNVDVEFKTFLIGTQGFAALNLVTPDFVVPNGFLFTTNGTVNFAENSDIRSYESLPTSGGLSYNGNGVAMLNSPTNFAGGSATIAVSAAQGPLNYSDMWWGGSTEDGWGMSIQQHGNTQFNALYVYDNAGKPTWYVLPTGTWNSTFTTYTGAIYQPTSAPLNNYTKAAFVVPPSPGSVTLTFTSASTATMQYTINGQSGTKSISRQVFGKGSAPMNVGDMWWVGSVEDGWGINLVQQAGAVFAVWYTYGSDGKPTWFVLPDGAWAGNTYSGTLYSTTGSAWLGTNYNKNLLAVATAGTLSFNFANANNATMNYSFTSGPFAGVTQSKSVVRQAY
jgi:hypothetical protein